MHNIILILFNYLFFYFYLYIYYSNFILQIGTFVKQKIPSSCPPDLKYIIDWCWMDDPQQRPTFKELTVQFKKFGEKFKTIDLHDQKVKISLNICKIFIKISQLIFLKGSLSSFQFLENSMNTLRKSMMEEIAAIADEMMKKANELQKREEKFFLWLNSHSLLHIFCDNFVLHSKNKNYIQ